MGTKMYPNDELRDVRTPTGPNFLVRFVRYLFDRAAAYDRGWHKGWDTGYDTGYEAAKTEVTEWYEPTDRR